jgi:hypothetical protein
MKILARTLAMTVAVPALAFAQTVPTGTQTGPVGSWRAQGAPWVIELKMNGAVLTGTVAQQNGLGAEITEGKFEGNTVDFKIKTASGGVITFVGKLSGDEIAFTREARFPGAPGPGEFGLFGNGEPTQFVVNRVNATWNGTIRNAPTRRNQTPNPNPRAVSFGVKKVPTPHWRWRGGDKETEVRVFTLPMGSFELSTYDLSDDRLSYSFVRPNQGDEILCSLTRQPAGKFAGTCASDAGGFNVLIELTPPPGPGK